MPGRALYQSRRRRPLPFDVGGALLLLAVMAARGASEDSVATEAMPWRVGRAVSIATTGETTRFTFPTPRPGSRLLVVVSALARAAGPFPIELTARSIDRARVEPPALDPEHSPRHSAVLPAFRLAPVAEPVVTPAPSKRTFHLMVRDGDVASASNYIAVAGTLRATGRRVQVYVDDNDAPVNAAVLGDLVGTFDTQVFPLAARTFGQARDVDGDGRFTVLMSSWLTRLSGGRHAVDGFVRGADLDLALDAPFSNHCDMMYLSTALAAGPHLRTVLAHEYTHAVSFSVKAIPNPREHESRSEEEEGWLDEGLAHLVEDLHGFSRTNLDYRVSAFLSQPERYRLAVGDYYAADLFRSHGNRGAAYLFLRCCADRYGPRLLPVLIRSERVGIANLEAATGESFEDLYRAWSLALFFSGFDPAHGAGTGFRSVDLRGPIGGWELAGPRATIVTPGGRAESWRSAGTASRFLVVEASPTGALEVEVTAAPEAALQVTAVPLPDDMANLDLSVRVAPGPRGAASLMARLEERHGTPLRLISLAWEPLVPGADPHAPAFRRASLKSAAIAAAFGSSTLPAHGRLDSVPIPCSRAIEQGIPLIVKVVAADARGRRVSAWAMVAPDAVVEDSLQPPGQ